MKNAVVSSSRRYEENWDERLNRERAGVKLNLPFGGNSKRRTKSLLRWGTSTTSNVIVRIVGENKRSSKKREVRYIIVSTELSISLRYGKLESYRGSLYLPCLIPFLERELTRINHLERDITKAAKKTYDVERRRRSERIGEFLREFRFKM